MEKEEVGTASIPALGDVAGVLEGPLPAHAGGRLRTMSGGVMMCNRGGRGTCRVSFGLDYITMLLLFGEGG